MARSNTKVDLLRRVPLFAGCKPGLLEDVSRLADEVDVQDGYVLIREGAQGQQFIMIVEGNVRIERGGVAIRTLGPGEFLGEIALIDKGRATATATVEGPARLLVMGRREFNTMLDASAPLRLAIMTSLAKRVRQLEQDTPN